jgi:signal transduction histidine kinase
MMGRLWRWLASFRRRILFRAVFAALVAATLGLALAVLQQEKQQRIASHRAVLAQTLAQLAARLQHPSGQLLLMNPGAWTQASAAPLRPLRLPYSVLDADDPVRLLQAMETAGCLVQLGERGAVCAAVAGSALAGGFLYVAGYAIDAADAVPRAAGERDATRSHRLQVTVEADGRRQQWVAPFEAPAGVRRGRLAGFEGEGPQLPAARPQREFRGWLVQDRPCAAAQADCRRRATFALRLPIEAWRDALFEHDGRADWPPARLAEVRVHLRWHAPGEGPALLDSDDPAATPPLSLAQLRALLQPGETMRVSRGGRELLALQPAAPAADAPGWLVRLVRRLPAEGANQPLLLTTRVHTPDGAHELALGGDARSVDVPLAAAALRLAGFVAAMLLAIVLAWLLIEVALIRGIAVLTRRTRAATATREASGVTALQVADLRGSDELGILAGALADLVQRVREEGQRERLRAEREKDQWHAVGHEIMSPLQSLLALHPSPDDPSARYVRRMQQAVQVLYGKASPSEAFAATSLELQPLDLHAFLRHVADNAPAEGIADVLLQAPRGLGALYVRADEYPLEDVLAHLLRNADRHREPGSPITLQLSARDGHAELAVHNRGPRIAPELLGRVFEYGVSGAGAPNAADAADAADDGRRGQGLFVAKTYMAKMGGSIEARNAPDGVSFVMRLPLA